MTGISNSHGTGPQPGNGVSDALMVNSATVVLDDGMRLIGWSREAEELFGHRPLDVLGRSADEILADTETGVGLCSPGDGRAKDLGIRPVRHRDGRSVYVALALSPLSHGAAGAAWLVTATDVEVLHQRSLDRALLVGIYRELPFYVVLYDTTARVQWINTATEKQFGMPLREVAGRLVKDIFPQGEVLSEDGRQPTDIEGIVEHVARTGEPMIDVRFRSPTP